MVGERLDEGLRRIGLVFTWGIGITVIIGGYVEWRNDPEVEFWLVLVFGGLGFLVPMVSFTILRWIIRGFSGRSD